MFKPQKIGEDRLARCLDCPVHRHDPSRCDFTICWEDGPRDNASDQIGGRWSPSRIGWESYSKMLGSSWAAWRKLISYLYYGVNVAGRRRSLR